jgi:trehalose 6-phosphate phosphatase
MRDAATSLLEPITEDPAHAGVLVDFDGTLAPIVDDPAVARPLPEAAELLGQLAHRYRVVAVLSGRPVGFLREHLPPSVVLSGLYGLEVLEANQRRDHPWAGAWREVIDDVVATARASGPTGMRVEPKGLSLTLHYRTAPEIEATVQAWARRQAARSGLQARPARMSVELHPPIDSNKGSAIAALAEGLRAVCYIGDDSGDLPAFAALDRLREEGVHTVRVAVRSDEAPPELLDRADLVVDGPDGVRDLLKSLL